MFRKQCPQILQDSTWWLGISRCRGKEGIRWPKLFIDMPGKQSGCNWSHLGVKWGQQLGSASMVGWPRQADTGGAVKIGRSSICSRQATNSMDAARGGDSEAGFRSSNRGERRRHRRSKKSDKPSFSSVQVMLARLRLYMMRALANRKKPGRGRPRRPKRPGYDLIGRESSHTKSIETTATIDRS
jgi:hypothetical protein